MLRRTLALVAGSVLLMASPAWSQLPDTITFDEIPAQDNCCVLVDAFGPYQGLTWHNFIVGKMTVGAAVHNGYGAGLVSRPNLIINADGNPASFSSLTPFTFASAWLTAGWNEGLNVSISGFNGSTLVAQTTIAISATLPTKITLNWTGLTEVRFSSSGGIPYAPYAPFGGPGTQFALDDLTIARPGPTLDSDGDGVPDDIDQCPGTPMGSAVDADGCITLAVPVNLRASQHGQNGNEIGLTWFYGSGPVDGFRVYRKAPSDRDWPTTPRATISLSALPLETSDTVPVPFGTYSYRVTAYKGGIESSPSNVVTVYQLETLYSGPNMAAFFTPDHNVGSMQEAAAVLGFDHFNWISVVNHDPQCYLNGPDSQRSHAFDVTRPGFPTKGLTLFAPFLDPPLGGYWEYQFYENGPSDGLPYYWNEQHLWYLDPSVALNRDYDIAGAETTKFGAPAALFGDQPGMQCLPGDDPAPATEYWSFVTTLVGVSGPVGTQSSFAPLASFIWSTTYNGRAGSANGVSLLNLEPPIVEGTGGVFNVANVAVQDLPLNVRQLLIQAGAQGVSTVAKVDRDAPLTAASISAPQGLDAWHRGSVTVRLITTDIDGPSDIASTSYRIDGGPMLTYTAPFVVFGDGTRTVQFGSVDQAGNAELLKSVTFKIDQTPPTIIGFRSPDANASGWNHSPVTITFQCSDSLSGLAAGSPPAPTAVGTHGAGQSVTGTCSDLAGNSASLTMSDINIDLAAPTISGGRSPAPNANGWNNSPVTVTFQCADTLSGLAAGSPPPATAITGEGSDESASATCADLAGNTASVSVQGINIDLTAPTLTPPADQTVSQTSSAGAIVNYPAPLIADALSGLASSSCLPVSGSVFPPGATTVTCTATDLAGNASSGTFRVTVTSTATPDGRMFGVGFVNQGGAHHHFVFRVAQVRDQDYGRFEYWANDPRFYGRDDDDDRDANVSGNPSNHFEATSITNVVFSDNPSFQPGRRPRPTLDTVRFSGTGRWNSRSGFTFEVVAADNGEPGRHRDTFSLVVKDPRGNIVGSVNGALDEGNVESTRLNP